MGVQVTVNLAIEGDLSRLDEVKVYLKTRYTGGCEIESAFEGERIVTLIFETEMYGDETPDDLSARIESEVNAISNAESHVTIT